MTSGYENLSSGSTSKILADSLINFMNDSDPVHTGPDPCSLDISFGQFTVIFTLTTFSMIRFN